MKTWNTAGDLRHLGWTASRCGWSSRFTVSVLNVPHRPKGGRCCTVGHSTSRYHKIRAEHGWVAWPVYLVWVALACGIAMSIVGFFLYFGTSPTDGR